MDTLHIHTHTHTGTSTWQCTLSQRTLVYTHIHAQACVWIWLHPHRLGFLAAVSDSFGALVQGSGGREREREGVRDVILFTARLCIAYAYFTLTFLSLHSFLSLSPSTLCSYFLIPLNSPPLLCSPCFLHSDTHSCSEAVR